jgi:hypothetical protein
LLTLKNDSPTVISDRPPTRATLRRNGLAIRRPIDRPWRSENNQRGKSEAQRPKLRLPVSNYYQVAGNSHFP